MRLLHAEDFTFKESVGKNIPKYAIISHKWKDEEEVSYEDFVERRVDFSRGLCNGYGWTKIAKAGEVTLGYGLLWFWIDTCCIDKKSSAELSEAINSMFKWYRKSEICYVFLSDVSTFGFPAFLDETTHLSVSGGRVINMNDFKSSIWFSRAWTLQELLAPTHVAFMSSDFLSTWYRHDWLPKRLVSETTTIPEQFLGPGWTELREASVAQRMKWASGRQSTREEEVAYSLLGLFGVNMPLLYGEGNRAFMRLQSEIIRSSNDESIFAWKFDRPILRTGLLAHSVRCFSSAEGIDKTSLVPRLHYEQTNIGLRMNLPVPADMMKKSLDKHGYAVLLTPLNCNIGADECPVLELSISRMPGSSSSLTHLCGRRAHGQLSPVVKDFPPLFKISAPRSRLSKFADSRQHTSSTTPYILSGIGDNQTDVSIYFPQVIELDARGPESLDLAALSDEWGVRTIFAEKGELLTQRI